MSLTKRPALIATVLAASLAFAACGGDDDNATTGATETDTGSRQAGSPPGSGAEKPSGPKPVTIVVRGGGPVGGPQELEYEAGDQVYLRVRSDVADEVHVHGYDIGKEVPAGGEVTLSFDADLEGIFEIELEQRGEELAELRVNP